MYTGKCFSIQICLVGDGYNLYFGDGFFTGLSHTLDSNSALRMDAVRVLQHNVDRHSVRLSLHRRLFVTRVSLGNMFKNTRAHVLDEERRSEC